MSDTRVKNVWNTIQKNLASAEVDAEGIYYRTDTRQYAVYFAPTEEEIQAKIAQRKEWEEENRRRFQEKVAAEVVGAGI